MSTRTFKTWRNPYQTGITPCRPRQVEIKSGLTVFVGCNGSGKTTLLETIKENLSKTKTPMLYYNNLHDGGGYSISESLYHNDISLMGALWTASEGEAITINLSKVVKQLEEFIKTGETDKTKEKKKWDALLCDEPVKEETVPNERWILLDAVDSGLSIDNILDLKEIFKTISEYAQKLNIDLYIITVANEYELANSEDCFDVTNGKYIRFKTYNSYRRFIIKSREKKNKRNQTAYEKQQKTVENSKIERKRRW